MQTFELIISMKAAQGSASAQLLQPKTAKPTKWPRSGASLKSLLVWHGVSTQPRPRANIDGIEIPQRNNLLAVLRCAILLVTSWPAER